MSTKERKKDRNDIDDGNVKTYINKQTNMKEIVFKKVLKMY